MKIIVNNLAVEYDEQGSGPVILLLHGWKDDLHTFDALIPLLSGSARVVRLDFPGFGGSQLPSEAWGVGEYARFVEDFCQKLRITPEILVGHSFGGRIALKGIAEGLFHPRKLVLIGSAGLAKHRTMRALAFNALAKAGKVVLSFFPTSIQESFCRKLYQKAGSKDYLTAGALKETFLKVTQEDLSETARAIKVPTLLVWGEDDTETPLSDGKRLHGLISGSRLEVIEGAGHFVHQERPEEIAKMIKRFVS